MLFRSHVRAIGLGSSVKFPNSDNIRHMVYSLSGAKKFELPLYIGKEAPAVVFDNAGLVTLGCNIHDKMQGFIRVTTTPYAARTDGNGLAAIEGLGRGNHDTVVWHPRIRAPGGEWRGKLTMEPGNRLRIVVAVRPGAAR